MQTNSLRFSPLVSILSIALLIILSGCGKSHLTTRSLSQLPMEHALTSSDNAIRGSYSVLRARSCTNYLGRNVISKGYQPIYISITNTSHQAVQFSHKNISLPTKPAKKVARACHLNTAGHFALGTAGCIVGIPLMLFGAGTTLMVPILGVALGGGFQAWAWSVPILAVGTGLTVGSIKNGVDTVKTNGEIDELFSELSLTDRTIYPHTTINGLIFVPKKKFNPNFQITFTDSTSRAIVLESTHIAADA
jgi:hypothetical protein